MGKAGFTVDEIRVNVRDPKLTHIYAFVTITGDFDPSFGGWKHLVLPAEKAWIGELPKHLGKVLRWDSGGPASLRES